MSELIDNARKRKELLKHMILQLHEGTAPEAVRARLVELLGKIPYNDIVAVEQELIAEGLPQEEVLKLCDIHSAALEGAIDHTEAKTAPEGHPVHTFQQENKALLREVSLIEDLIQRIPRLPQEKIIDHILSLRSRFNALMDVEKHYLRKENLLFPFLEKHGVTGPPTVMWGKHDETRELLKAALEGLAVADISLEELQSLTELVLRPAVESVEGMISKEEEILFPMSLDTLTDEEWHEVERQSPEYGFCLYDPQVVWAPKTQSRDEPSASAADSIRLPSGSFTTAEITALLNTIPFDLTFVDKEDRVRFFTQGKERIFARSRAIIGRKVQQCHPPSSVHVVEKILDDFKQGRQDHAPFWIQMNGRFIHIEYFALRDAEGRYLGTIEVSQDLTEKRSLEGEQRLLKYGTKE